MRNIFYLENDLNDFFFLDRALKKLGFNGVLRWFRTSAELKDELLGLDQSRQPAGLLLDLKLDGESGLDVLAWVRKQRELAGLPVFLISSGRIPYEILAAMQEDATAYFFKPCHLDGFSEIGRGLLQAVRMTPLHEGLQLGQAGSREPRLHS